MRPLPVVGQLIFSRRIGNSYKKNNAESLIPFRVNRVGRKYFYAGPVDGEPWQDLKYHVEGWSQVSNYSPDSVLYVTMDEWRDEVETEKIISRMREAFSYGGHGNRLSLTRLKKIDELIQHPE